MMKVKARQKMHGMHLKFLDHTIILRIFSPNHLPRLFLSLTVLGLLGATCWHESGCWGWSSSKLSSARVFDGDMLGTGIFASVRLERWNRSTGCGDRTPAGLRAGRLGPSHEDIRAEIASVKRPRARLLCLLPLGVFSLTRPASLYQPLLPN